MYHSCGPGSSDREVWVSMVGPDRCWSVLAADDWPTRKRAKDYARVHAGLGVPALHQWWIRDGLLRPAQGDERTGDGDPLRPAAPGHVPVLHAREVAQPAPGVAA